MAVFLPQFKQKQYPDLSQERQMYSLDKDLQDWLATNAATYGGAKNFLEGSRKRKLTDAQRKSQAGAQEIVDYYEKIREQGNQIKEYTNSLDAVKAKYVAETAPMTSEDWRGLSLRGADVDRYKNLDVNTAETDEVVDIHNDLLRLKHDPTAVPKYKSDKVKQQPKAPDLSLNQPAQSDRPKTLFATEQERNIRRDKAYEEAAERHKRLSEIEAMMSRLDESDPRHQRLNEQRSSALELTQPYAERDPFIRHALADIERTQKLKATERRIADNVEYMGNMVQAPGESDESFKERRDLVSKDLDMQYTLKSLYETGERQNIRAARDIGSYMATHGVSSIVPVRATYSLLMSMNSIFRSLLPLSPESHEYYDALQEGFNASTGRWWSDVPTKLAGSMAYTVIGMGMMAATSGAAAPAALPMLGKVASGALMATSMINRNIIEASQEYGSYTAIRDLGLTFPLMAEGLVEAAIEYASNLIQLDFIRGKKKITEAMAKEAAKSAVIENLLGQSGWQTVKSLGSAAIVEGMEEVMQGFSNYIFDVMMGKIEPMTGKELGTQLLEEFAYGAMGGLLVGGVGHTIYRSQMKSSVKQLHALAKSGNIDAKLLVNARNILLNENINLAKDLDNAAKLWDSVRLENTDGSNKYSAKVTKILQTEIARQYGAFNGALREAINYAKNMETDTDTDTDVDVDMSSDQDVTALPSLKSPVEYNMPTDNLSNTFRIKKNHIVSKISETSSTKKQKRIISKELKRATKQYGKDSAYSEYLRQMKEKLDIIEQRDKLERKKNPTDQDKQDLAAANQRIAEINDIIGKIEKEAFGETGEMNFKSSDEIIAEQEAREREEYERKFGVSADEDADTGTDTDTDTDTDIDTDIDTDTDTDEGSEPPPPTPPAPTPLAKRNLYNFDLPVDKLKLEKHLQEMKSLQKRNRTRIAVQKSNGKRSVENIADRIERIKKQLKELRKRKKDTTSGIKPINVKPDGGKGIDTETKGEVISTHEELAAKNKEDLSKKYEGDIKEWKAKIREKRENIKKLEAENKALKNEDNERAKRQTTCNIETIARDKRSISEYEARVKQATEKQKAVNAEGFIEAETKKVKDFYASDEYKDLGNLEKDLQIDGLLDEFYKLSLGHFGRDSSLKDNAALAIRALMSSEGYDDFRGTHIDEAKRTKFNEAAKKYGLELVVPKANEKIDRGRYKTTGKDKGGYEGAVSRVLVPALLGSKGETIYKGIVTEGGKRGVPPTDQSKGLVVGDIDKRMDRSDPKDTKAIPAERLGKEETLHKKDKKVKIRYALVPLKDIVVSHTTNFNQNEQYPQEIQNRDRTSMKADTMMKAHQLKPELLLDNPLASDGRPIVFVDNEGKIIVLGGNGRVLALTIKKGSMGGVAEYEKVLRERLSDFGIKDQDVKGMMLVGVYYGDENLVELSRTLNLPEQTVLTQVEVAESDATILANARERGNDLIALVNEDATNVLSKANGKFIRAFMEMCVDDPRQVVAEDGTYKVSFKERIENALFMYVFNNNPRAAALLQMYVETESSSIKSVMNAIMSSVNSISKLRNLIEQHGLVDLDITNDLLSAMYEIDGLRKNKINIINVLTQQNIFSEDNVYIPDDLHGLYLSLSTIKSNVKANVFIKGYYGAAFTALDPNQVNIFEDKSLNKKDFLDTYIKEWNNDYNKKDIKAAISETVQKDVGKSGKKGKGKGKSSTETDIKVSDAEQTSIEADLDQMTESSGLTPLEQQAAAAKKAMVDALDRFNAETDPDKRAELKKEFQKLRKESNRLTDEVSKEKSQLILKNTVKGDTFTPLDTEQFNALRPEHKRKYNNNLMAWVYNKKLGMSINETKDHLRLVERRVDAISRLFYEALGDSQYKSLSDGKVYSYDEIYNRAVGSITYLGSRIDGMDKAELKTALESILGADKMVRAAAMRDAEGKFKIGYTKNASTSSVLHENAHTTMFYIEDEAKAGNPVAKAMYKTLCKWLGATEHKLTREQHEHFADSFTWYMYHGVTVDTEIDEVYSSMRDWLKAEWGQQRELNKSLPKDVVKVFNLILGAIDTETYLQSLPEYVAAVKDTNKETQQGRAPPKVLIKNTIDYVSTNKDFRHVVNNNTTSVYVNKGDNKRLALMDIYVNNDGSLQVNGHRFTDMEKARAFINSTLNSAHNLASDNDILVLFDTDSEDAVEKVRAKTTKAAFASALKEDFDPKTRAKVKAMATLLLKYVAVQKPNYSNIRQSLEMFLLDILEAEHGKDLGGIISSLNNMFPEYVKTHGVPRIPQKADTLRKGIHAMLSKAGIESGTEAYYKTLDPKWTGEGVNPSMSPKDNRAENKRALSVEELTDVYKRLSYDAINKGIFKGSTELVEGVKIRDLPFVKLLELLNSKAPNTFNNLFDSHFYKLMLELHEDAIKDGLVESQLDSIVRGVFRAIASHEASKSRGVGIWASLMRPITNLIKLYGKAGAKLVDMASIGSRAHEELLAAGMGIYAEMMTILNGGNINKAGHGYSPDMRQVMGSLIAYVTENQEFETTESRRSELKKQVEAFNERIDNDENYRRQYDKLHVEDVLNVYTNVEKLLSTYALAIGDLNAKMGFTAIGLIEDYFPRRYLRFISQNFEERAAVNAKPELKDPTPLHAKTRTNEQLVDISSVETDLATLLVKYINGMSKYIAYYIPIEYFNKQFDADVDPALRHRGNLAALNFLNNIISSKPKMDLVERALNRSRMNLVLSTIAHSPKHIMLNMAQRLIVQSVLPKAAIPVFHDISSFFNGGLKKRFRGMDNIMSVLDDISVTDTIFAEALEKWREQSKLRGDTWWERAVDINDKIVIKMIEKSLFMRQEGKNWTYAYLGGIVMAAMTTDTYKDYIAEHGYSAKNAAMAINLALEDQSVREKAITVAKNTSSVVNPNPSDAYSPPLFSKGQWTRSILWWFRFSVNMFENALSVYKLFGNLSDLELQQLVLLEGDQADTGTELLALREMTKALAELSKTMRKEGGKADTKVKQIEGMSKAELDILAKKAKELRTKLEKDANQAKVGLLRLSGKGVRFHRLGRHMVHYLVIMAIHMMMALFNNWAVENISGGLIKKSKKSSKVKPMKKIVTGSAMSSLDEVAMIVNETTILGGALPTMEFYEMDNPKSWIKKISSQTLLNAYFPILGLANNLTRDLTGSSFTDMLEKSIEGDDSGGSSRSRSRSRPSRSRKRPSR